MRVLKKNHAFSHIIRRGKRLQGRYLSIHYRKRRDKDPSRFGVTCSKGIGNAVERNRLKRQLREIARSLGSELPEAYDFVFMARPHAKETEYQAILSEARSLFGASNLLTSSENEQKG